MVLRHFLAAVLLSLLTKNADACQCPVSQLNLEEVSKYEIIFRGTIKSVKPCDNKFGEAIFELQELYKGNATKDFKVLFECDNDCEQHLTEGEEWIIYSRYKQIDNALLDWCSRSRKYFKNQKEDFYLENYGNDYFAELNFLRTNLGQHRFLTGVKNSDGNRNIIPKSNQMVFILLISLVSIVAFYLVFKKLFR